MFTYLQNQIKTRMKSKNLTVYSLEKRAGLKRSAVRNILDGFSQKPSAECLKAIAEALECTLNDLVGPTEYVPIAGINATRCSYPWDEVLYIDSIKAASFALDEAGTLLQYNQVLNLASETYKYSVDKGTNEIDKDFTKWLARKSLKIILQK